MDYSIYLKMGIKAALQETSDPIRDESLGETAKGAKAVLEGYLKDKNPNVDVDAAINQIKRFIDHLKEHESELSDIERDFLKGYTEFLDNFKKAISNEKPETSEGTNENASVPTDEASDSEEDPFEHALKIINTSADPNERAEAEALIQSYIAGAMAGQTAANGDDLYDYAEAIVPYLEDKTKDDIENLKKASSDQLKDNQNIIRELKNKIAKDKFFESHFKSSEQIFSIINHLYKPEGQEIRILEENSNIVSEQLNSSEVIPGTQDEEHPNGKTAKEIWLEGFRDLAILNRNVNKVKKEAESLGLGTDMTGILTTIGTVCAAIGTVGSFATRFIPMDPITKKIVRGAFKSVTGLGGMLTSTPNAIKAFKSGDKKKGLALLAGSVVSATVIASGIKDVTAGVQWSSAQSMMNQMLDNPDQLKADIDKKLENPKLNDAQRASLVNARSAIDTVQAAQAAHVATPEELKELVNNPTNRAQMLDTINGELHDNVDKAIEVRQEQEALAAMDEMNAASETAAANGGTYAPQDLLKYVNERAGTGANGGWLNSSLGNNPEMDRQARELLNSHPDIKVSTEKIMQAQTELNKANNALALSQSEMQTALEKIQNSESLEGYGFDKGMKKQLGDAYGDFTKMGSGKSKTWAVANITNLENDFKNMLSGNEAAIPEERLNACKALVNQANADSLAGKETPFTSLLKGYKDLDAAQAKVDTATTAVNNAKRVLSSGVGTQMTQLKTMEHLPRNIGFVSPSTNVASTEVPTFNTVNI